MTIIAHDSPQKAFVMHAYPGKKVGSEPHVLGLLSYYLFLLHPLPYSIPFMVEKSHQQACAGRCRTPHQLGCSQPPHPTPQGSM
jgi:hypothetical protein